MILSLPKSSSFSKSGRDIFESKNSIIYHGDIDADNTTEILVLETNFKSDRSISKKTFNLSPDIHVYKYDGNTFNRSAFQNN